MTILIALLLQASAEPQVDCTDPLTQTAMNICAHRDYQAADRELDAVYKQAVADMKRMDASTTFEDGRTGYYETLRDAQRAWIAFRDAHCASEGYLARGGSMEPLLVSTCKAQLTRERTGQLRDLVDWPR